MTKESNLCGISGLSVLTCTPHVDDRGSFTETYNRRDFLGAGIPDLFIQDNEVFTKRRTLRGFDVNLNHPQPKLLRVVSGAILDVVIDMRSESNTFLKVHRLVLRGNDHKVLYIPERFAHAYLALEDTVIQFKTTNHFIPNDEIRFAWDSEFFSVKWPDIGEINASPYPEFSENMLL